MKYKKFLPYIIYFLLFLFLFFLESKLGVRAFSVALFGALVYNKSNLLILAPIYVVSAIIVSPTLITLAIVSAPIVIVFTAYFVHYKIKKRISVVHVNLYVFLAEIPKVFFSIDSQDNVIRLIVGVILAQILIPILVSATYTIIKKKGSFLLSRQESVALGVCVAILALGCGFLEIKDVNFYYAIGMLLIIAFANVKAVYSLGGTLFYALGGLLSIGSVGSIAILLYGALISSFSRKSSQFVTFLALTMHALLILIGALNESYFSLIPPLIIAIIYVCIPKKLKQGARNAIDAFYAGRSARAIVNKDRKETAEKLLLLAEVMGALGDIIGKDIEEKERIDTKKLADKVADTVCGSCKNFSRCKSVLRGESTTPIVEELIYSALVSGRATILDAPPFLSSYCIKINNMISSTNEILSVVNNNTVDGVGEEKNVIKEEMLGLSSALKALSSEVQSPISYDIKGERDLTLELNRHDLCVKDTILYRDNGSLQLGLIVDDVALMAQGFVDTLSDVVGKRMALVKKEKVVNNSVFALFEECPKYGVAYGEECLSLEEGACGDTTRAVRLGNSKVMFILSDGMGSGEHAERSSVGAVSMLENFYKGGFEHKAVMSFVSRFMSTRNTEDFNAIDIAVFDTKNASVDFIKQGARESFILRNGEVEVIECGSLPLGIVEDVEPIIETRSIDTDTFVVMVSDGVIDTIGKEGLVEILSGIKTRNPEVISKAIIDNAKRLMEDSHKDDASVICARLYTLKQP